MDKNMHDRLEASQKRLKEIDELLLDNSVCSDMKQFKNLSKNYGIKQALIDANITFEKGNT